ncbi:MAG: hypothetical protein ACOYW3_10220 [Bacteroidota bacterium]
MRVQAETYKGIEFVRISNLPKEERTKIFETLNREKIIKILRDKELLNDCVQVTDYKEWLNSQKPVEADLKEVTEALKAESFKLAFK